MIILRPPSFVFPNADMFHLSIFPLHPTPFEYDVYDRTIYDN